MCPQLAPNLPRQALGGAPRPPRVQGLCHFVTVLPVLAEKPGLGMKGWRVICVKKHHKNKVWFKITLRIFDIFKVNCASNLGAKHPITHTKSRNVKFA